MNCVLASSVWKPLPRDLTPRLAKFYSRPIAPPIPTPQRGGPRFADSRPADALNGFGTAFTKGPNLPKNLLQFPEFPRGRLKVLHFGNTRGSKLPMCPQIGLLRQKFEIKQKSKAWDGN